MGEGTYHNLSLTLISLYDPEKKEERPPEPSVTPSPEKPAREIDICRGNTSFLVDKLKEGFKIECCNVKLFA